MEIPMADEAATETETTAAAETSGDSTEATATEATTTEGEKALGDAGKKALDAMKAKWKEADAAAKATATELAAFKAKAEGREAEHQAAQAAQAFKDEALAAANKRILNSEIKAAAKGVLADPADAYKFLDLDQFQVDADGNTDEKAIADALADLVASKPYLAAQGGQRFQGSADGGARNDASKVAQLTRTDMARMSPEQIAQAEANGQFDQLLGRS